MKRPLVIGRGPWAQKILAALLEMPNVQPTLVGRGAALDSIKHARERGNDLVIVASALPSHYELVMASLSAGLPTFCEKPFMASVQEAACVKALIEAQGAAAPLLLCDYTHCWSAGFEYAWASCQERFGTGPAPKFWGVFGGHVQRTDTHPVWDYGSHPIAMALLLGADMTDLKLDRCVDCPYEWTVFNDHTKIHIGCYPKDSILEHKDARVKFGALFEYDQGTWTFKDGTHGEVGPPLQRALKFFLSDAPPQSIIHTGIDLALQVTKVLESLCPSGAP